MNYTETNKPCPICECENAYFPCYKCGWGKVPTDVYRFGNGNVFVSDEDGGQIPYLQDTKDPKWEQRMREASTGSTKYNGMRPVGSGVDMGTEQVRGMR